MAILYGGVQTLFLRFVFSTQMLAKRVMEFEKRVIYWKKAFQRNHYSVLLCDFRWFGPNFEVHFQYTYALACSLCIFIVSLVVRYLIMNA